MSLLAEQLAECIKVIQVTDFGATSEAALSYQVMPRSEITIKKGVIKS